VGFAVSPLRQLLASGQQAGEFGSFDPDVMALAIRAIVDVASFYFTAHPDLDLDHYIDQVVQLFDKPPRHNRRPKGVNMATPTSAVDNLSHQTTTRPSAPSSGSSAHTSL
jgi:hypothetical protein